MNFLVTRTAYYAKAENSVEFSASEPRSGEGRISGRGGASARLSVESRSSAATAMER
ncbi:MAG: hypothetical protein MJY80_05935 [Bacteroidales bacterium]|nr:hypothetical protein [Bacteroidales bacterium]